MNITAATTTEELLKILTNPDTDESTYTAAAAENRRRLLEEKQKKEEFVGKIRDVVNSVKSLGISFDEFMKATDSNGQPAFTSKDVKQYAQNQGWMKDRETNAATTDDDTDKPEVIVGTFKLSDYGFTMPMKGKSSTPIAADTELKWDINKFYPATTWQYKFIKSITAKGLEDLQKHLTPEFKSWLEEHTIPNKGPMANKAIFKNKRKFMAYFGLDENGEPLKDGNPS